MFDFLKKNSDKKNKLHKEDKNDIDIAVAYSNYTSIENSVEAAQIKFEKPEYNPQTRHDIYDNLYSHKKAIDNAFETGETVRDPYTGLEILRTQQEAKLKYGDDWQLHVAEADHIDTLNKIVERHQNDAFTTKENIRDVANRDDNLQIISRASNQSSKDMGKGGSTQREWAKDQERMRGMGESSELGSIEQIKRKIRYRGDKTEAKSDDLLQECAIKNAIETGHKAGLDGALNAGVTSTTMASIDGLVTVLKGDKSVSEALKDVAKVGGESAVKSYIRTGGMTLLTHKLKYSTNEFIKSLAKNNVPSQILTGVQVAGSAIAKWMNGEITTQECFLTVGQNGINYATMPFWATVGQGLIPIPIVGAAIGTWFGSVMTGSFISSYFEDLKRREYEHLQRQKRIREYEIITAKYNAYQKEFDTLLNNYLQDCRNSFDEAISCMQIAFENRDAEGFVRNLSKITEKVNGKSSYETFEEFKNAIDSDKEFVL